ncbi:MAG TPA: hypothetical protein PKW18_00990 [Candidatus Sumerlaeota bacterium]|nr:hypothetical protein [Candidatus Sumerlaeota bacterium]HON49278.1 hypothetical protein [Candidatus Sumerlaeota bacterium]HOR64115.1 hypothetical protein [Candidatus Sumerlaeota bacterium]HPL73128.1 hypothetical protein [Candidatus Sumerlaeota bacterium]HRU53915.1 hypothetical protein [Candidatus Sumerlaeia bacterium]
MEANIRKTPAWQVLISALVIFIAYYSVFFQEKTDLQAVAYLGVARWFWAGALIFLAAYASGEWALFFFRLRDIRPRVRLFLAMALGLGILSMLMCALGNCGMLTRGYAFFLLMGLALAGLPFYRQMVGEIFRWVGSIREKSSGAPVFICLCLLVMIFLLYGISALPLPINYDVMEYHLGAPQQSLRAGSLAPHLGIFYSYLPFGAEALFAAGMVVGSGEPFFNPKVIHFGFWLLACYGIYILAGLFGLERGWGLFAVVLFGMNRLVFSVGQDAFVEFCQTVYVVAALAAWVLWFRGRAGKPLFLSFIFWGFALGVKYSILGIGILPFLLILLPYGLYQREEKRFFILWAKYSFGGLLAVAIAFAPWMVRSLLYTGNPFFPFFSQVFRWDGWTPQQMAYYMQSNRAVAPFSPSHLWFMISKGMDVGAFYYLPLFLALILFRKERQVWALAGFAFLGCLVWNLFLQPPARFMVPIVPVMALVAAFVLRLLARQSKIGAACLIPYMAFILTAGQLHFVELFNTGYIKAALFCYDQRDFLMEQLGAYYEASQIINNDLPPDARILFIYEARIYYMERPAAANSVFDKSPLVEIAEMESDAEGMRNRLLSMGYTHVLLNEIELNRLIKTYAPRSVVEREGVASIFEDSRANLTAFENLYGSYHLDERFPANRKKIREFIALVEKRKIFERRDERGLAFYLSSLK